MKRSDQLLGYLLTLEERRTGFLTYGSSDEKDIYDKNNQKIIMMLILSTKMGDVSFSKEDVKIFNDAGHISIKVEDSTMTEDEKEERANMYSEEQMKTYTCQILLDQSIIAVISNLETYFKSIFERIFNDNTFLECYLRRSDKLRKFLVNKNTKGGERTGLIKELQEQVVLHGNTLENLKFGTYCIENRRISFQNVENIKSFLSIFEDIPFSNFSENKKRDNLLFSMWNYSDKDAKEIASLKNWIKTRNILIHGGKDENKVINDYDRNRIEQFLWSLDKMISIIDMTLFGYYTIDWGDGTTCIGPPVIDEN